MGIGSERICSAAEGRGRGILLSSPHQPNHLEKEKEALVHGMLMRGPEVRHPLCLCLFLHSPEDKGFSQWELVFLFKARKRERQASFSGQRKNSFYSLPDFEAKHLLDILGKESTGS